MKYMIFAIRSFMIIGLFGLICSCKSQDLEKRDYRDIYSVEQLKEDFSILRSSIEKCHAGLYANVSMEVLNQTFSQIASEINRPMSSIEFYNRLCPLLKVIENGHTTIHPPKDYLAAMNATLPRFPIAIYRTHDTIYVLRNLSEDESILPGTIIESINGVPAIEWVKTLADNLTRDAKNTSWPEGRIEQGFSDYFALHVGTPDTYELSLVDENNDKRTVQINALSISVIKTNYKKRYSEWLKRRKVPTGPALVFEIKGHVGILTVKSFSIPTIRKGKQNYKRFFKDVFAQLESSQVKRLILDIRHNGGGYPDVIIELYSYLAKTPYVQNFEGYTTIKKLPHRKHFVEGFWENLDIRTSLKLKEDGDIYRVTNIDKKTYPLKSNRFRDDLYVLFDPFTFSAASDLLGMLKDGNRGIFIGETAGGNPTRCTSWIMPTLRLPNSKLEAVIPLVHMYSPENSDAYEYGVVPDHHVQNSIEEEIKNIDGVMKFTFDLINQQGS